MRGGRAEKKHGGQGTQALGRSRGGFSTKLHIAVDALGNPLRFILTGGECHEGPHAAALVAGFAPRALIADKGYDADAIRAQLATAGVEAVIPAKSNRRTPISHDRVKYRWRNLVERLFSKLKNWRRVATRYDKTKESYLGFVTLASIKLWIPFVHDA